MMTTPGAEMTAFNALAIDCQHIWTFVEHRKRIVCTGCGIEMGDALRDGSRRF